MIIAEASLQHDSSSFRGIEVVRKAKNCGADAIKFQLFVPDEPLFCPLEGDERRWPKWEESILSFGQWIVIKKYCDEIGIDFMASVFQHGAVDLYKSLNPKWWKVASRAALSFPYIEIRGCRALVSCGLFNPSKAIPSPESLDIGIWKLECRVEYPHRPYRWAADCEGLWCGLSDHSGSPWPAIDALARGAEIVEVHVDFGRPEKLPEEITLDQLKLICEARDGFAAMREG